MFLSVPVLSYEQTQIAYFLSIGTMNSQVTVKALLSEVTVNCDW